MPNYTFNEKAEIYLRSMLYGLSSSIEYGIWAFFVVGCASTIGVSLNPCGQGPCDDQISYTADGVGRAATANGATAGIATMAFTFFPHVAWAINKGFQEGPSSIPLHR